MSDNIKPFDYILDEYMKRTGEESIIKTYIEHLPYIDSSKGIYLHDGSLMMHSIYLILDIPIDISIGKSDEWFIDLSFERIRERKINFILDS